MNFEYDSWNRIMTMEYPDGEKVDYKYNVGGLLSSMKGFKGNAAYPYIDSIHYNKFEAKTEIYYGNQTYATYDYDILQRLKHLSSYTSGGDTMQEIGYVFDNVNNITRIKNVSGVLNNGLGGNYGSNYSYDNMYRLTNARGSWNNGTNFTFDLSMDYAQDGRILQKKQTASQLLDGNQTLINYENTYTYNGGQPHALSHVDDNGSVNQNFEWDANGNLITHDHELLGSRKLCWDEENRIMGVADDNFISYYTYDAGGERTYKLTGAFQDMIINGQQYNFNLMNNPTLYTSPYLVATPQGYTKHFYAGSERILSKIGCGGFERLSEPIEIKTGESKSGGSKAASQPPQEPDPEPVFTPIINKIKNLNNMLIRTLNCLGKDPKIIVDNLKKLYGLKETQCEKENDLYYYHPDHLGSGTWITYTDGSAIQHLHYLPFGEEQIDQRLTGFNSRYTFSAKEKDVETGYSYFGARYYTSDLSIWLSVDPMSDKYPSLTPYNYCANNPVILVDPDGEDVWIPNEEDAAFINRFTDPKSPEYSKDFSDKYQKLVEGKKIYKFESWEGNADSEGLFTENSDECISLINFKKTADEDPTIGGGAGRTLFEEVFHAVEAEADPGHAGSVEEEAEAHKFSALAPGTSLDNTITKGTTVQGRILNAELLQVMGWLKNGMPSTETEHGIRGGALYPNLPVFRNPSKFTPIIRNAMTVLKKL